MTAEARWKALATRIGQEIKTVKGKVGDTSLLTTTAKDLAGAVNEVNAKPTSVSPPPASETVQGIVEQATLTEVATGTDASRYVTPQGVRQERAALKAELLGGASAAWDTLQELKVLIDSAEESTQIDALTTTVGGKVDKTALGDPEADLVASFEAALL